MPLFFVKVLISAVVIVLVSELAKRQSGVWAALLASLPLTSLLAFIWIYVETGSTETISRLSWDILWLVVPSLALFALLPVLLRHGINFWPSLALASVVTAVLYLSVLGLLKLTGGNG